MQAMKLIRNRLAVRLSLPLLVLGIALAGSAQAETSVTVNSSNITVPQTTSTPSTTQQTFTIQMNVKTNDPLLQQVVQQVVPPPSQQIKVSFGPDPHVAHGWDRKTSHTECGGMRRDGTPQPTCTLRPANYIGPARSACPTGSEFDAGLWQCWSCDKSKGFSKGSAGWDTPRACFKRATADEAARMPQFLPAIFLGPLCPKATDVLEDAFYDAARGGECWSCPKGYNMNVLVLLNAPDKCTRPVQDPLRFKYAQRDKITPWPHECAPGTFHDAWNGGACWHCPDGFIRTTNPVYSEQACQQHISADNKPAVRRGIAKCEDGTIQDPRNGGECWKCPEPYDRVGRAITDSNVCETTPGLVFARGKMAAAMTCPADQIYDPIAVSSAALSGLRQSGRADASAQTAPNGGTCWQCPPNSTRTLTSVTGGDACQGEKTEWYSAPYPEPGVFGLDGAEQVMDEILTYDRKLVDDTIREIVRQCAESNTPGVAACQTNPTKEVANAWNEIANTPGKSGVLMTLIFGRIVLAATDDSTPLPDGTRPVTAADRRLQSSFTAYLRSRRLYVAQEGLKAFDAWESATQARRDWAMKEAARLRTPYTEQITPPPDWNQIVEDGMLSTFAGVGVAAAGTTTAIMTSPTLLNKVFPSSKVRAYLAKGKEAVKGLHNEEITSTLEKSGSRIAKKLAQQLTDKVGEQVAESVLKFMKAGGPAFMVTAVVEVIVELAINFSQYDMTDRPHLLAMIAQAKEPFNLKRALLTNGQFDLTNSYWMMAISGDSLPSPSAAARFKTAAQSMTPSAAWTLLPGSAVDAGAGGNALWIVSTNPVPGGYGIYRWDGKNWAAMPGGGVRIDVDGKGNAWLVNSAGQIWRWNGSGWAGMPGEGALDIGVGENGTAWYVGNKKVPGGYSIYRWNAATNSWLDMKGGGMRIDVDAAGRAWVVTDTGKVYYGGSSGWIEVPGILARDIGVGPDGSVFVAAKDDGTVYKFNRINRTWVQRGGQLDAITVGPNGVPVGVNSVKQIWLGYQ